jgi:release factor glutamine methyltransferase
MRLLARAAEAAARLLRPEGSVLLELGGDQARAMTAALAVLGLSEIRVHRDDDGRDRAIEARRGETVVAPTLGGAQPR